MTTSWEFPTSILSLPKNGVFVKPGPVTKNMQFLVTDLWLHDN